MQIHGCPLMEQSTEILESNILVDIRCKSLKVLIPRRTIVMVHDHLYVKYIGKIVHDNNRSPWD